MQINDHVFIVTGASSGIGLSTAMALSNRGAKVALLARSGDALQELSQQLPGSLPVAAPAAFGTSAGRVSVFVLPLPSLMAAASRAL